MSLEKITELLRKQRLVEGMVHSQSMPRQQLVETMVHRTHLAEIQNLLHTEALTANGKTMGDNCATVTASNPDVIFPYSKPMREKAGFLVLSGNLFDSALIKTSVISPGIWVRSTPNSLQASRKSSPKLA